MADRTVTPRCGFVSNSRPCRRYAADVSSFVEPARHRPGRRRDRRDRGLRGELVPPGVPLRRSRSERFDDLVLDAVEHLEQRWSAELDGVEFAVEDVPPVPDGDDPAAELVPLARYIPAGPGRASAPRIVLHRRPIEARAADLADLADLVLDAVIHEVARMLNVGPEVIDPEGHTPDTGE